MNYFNNIFKIFKKNNPETLWDKFKQTYINYIRSRARNSNIALSLSDEKIFEICQEVFSEFHKIENKSDGEMPIEVSAYICFYFVILYEKFGGEWYNKHLIYEIEKYEKEGLRPDYLAHKIDSYKIP